MNEQAPERRFSGRWLWLFPVTYVAHAVEEIWAGGGYAAWISSLSGQPITDIELLVIHVALIVGMSAVVALVQARQRFCWSIVAFAVVVTGNTLMHAVSTWLTRSYSPGLVTGLVLWSPLGVFAVWRAHGSLRRADVAWGAAIGIVATLVISMLALNPSLIPLP